MRFSQFRVITGSAVNINTKKTFRSFITVKAHCSMTHLKQQKSLDYGRPLSVSGRPCYILPMFFIYLFFFLWPPYSPALVNGGSRKFYTWWTLSVIEEVTTWIFFWSSLNYRVGQKVTKFRIFSDPTRELSALTPERGRIL